MSQNGDVATVAPPITERILARVGPPKRLWITLWALVPLISPFVYVIAIRASGQVFGERDIINLVATQGALAYACFVLLWGSGALARQAVALREDLRRFVPGETPLDIFRAIGLTAGPIVLTAGVVAISVTYSWTRYGPLPALAGLPLLIVYMLPIMTFVWVYLTVLVEIDRLGRGEIVLDLFPQDRTLGLQQVGAVASSGLGLLLLAAAPVLLAGSDEPVTLGISLTIVVLAVGVFVLSMWRLHRQMAAAKARYVAMARRLYADAYAPIRDDPSIDALANQANALSAAQSLDARASDLLAWPIDEGTMKFMAVVVTGVVTSLVVRGLFAALGF
jgi:hypothetical protein